MPSCFERDINGGSVHWESHTQARKKKKKEIESLSNAPQPISG